MKKVMYTNKTVYTEKFYEKISRYRNLSGSSFYLLSFFIAVSAFIAIQNFKQEGTHVLGYLYLAIALLLLPVFSYLMPKISAKKSYRKLVEESGSNELTVTTEISDKIFSRNSAGKNSSRRFSEVIGISTYQGLMIITFRDRQTLYLDMNGFKPEEVEKIPAYLSEQTGVRVRNEDR